MEINIPQVAGFSTAPFISLKGNNDTKWERSLECPYAIIGVMEGHSNDFSLAASSVVNCIRVMHKFAQRNFC
jgi:hypothetical protein